ncbi:MAG TPA: hypothetical protein VFH04_03710 [Nitrososphaeraceae archaeon]|nr:hypothetical protein [Nitrososphaeraceae archaeon]
MKQIQIIIPDRGLKDVDEVLKDAQVGRGTMKYTPVYIPTSKVEVVLKDAQVDLLSSKIMDRFGAKDIHGKTFVLKVPIALDTRTGKRGESVI